MAVVIVHRLAGSKKALDACRLIAALHRRGRTVVAWTADPGRARILDEYLWTFDEASFVPHALWQGDEVEEPVLVLAGPLSNPAGADTLVLLEAVEPGMVAGFGEVHDLASPAEAVDRAGAWRAAGFDVAEVAGAALPEGRE